MNNSSEHILFEKNIIINSFKTDDVTDVIDSNVKPSIIFPLEINIPKTNMPVQKDKDKNNISSVNEFFFSLY